MRKFFLINIILLFLCVSDTDLVSSSAYHFYDTTKVELVDNYIADYTDTFEIYYSLPERKEFGFSNSLNYLSNDSGIIIKHQNSIYQEFRINLISIFITSHQTNILPQSLS